MGVPDGKYAVFRDFKRRVLDQSVSEVNAYSNLEIKPEIDRKGHQVVAIRFEIKQKTTSEKPLLDTKSNTNEADEKLDAEQEAVLNKLIRTFKFSEPLGRKFLKDYSSGFLQEKMDLIISSSAFVRGKITNITAYLIDALKNNYQINLAEKVVQQAKRHGPKDLNVYDEAYDEYLIREIGIKIKSLDSTGHGELLEFFETYLKKYESIFIEVYQSEGIESPLLKRALLNFVKAEKSEWLIEFLPYELFVTQRNLN
jgi:hypothetical protein